MISPKHMLFPAVVAASGLLFLLARFLTTPDAVIAATPASADPASSASITSASPCSLSLPDKVAPWCGLIESASVKYSVPAELIAAVMLQESGGQSDVISSSGAVGLLQVMPNDGIAASFMCGNGPCFASRPSTQELLDPSFNIDYGTRMLANLISKYGNERDALKAYGPYDVGYYYADKVMNIRSSILGQASASS